MRSRLRLGLVLVISVVIVVAQAGVAPPATAAPAPAATPAETAARDDLGAARITARSTGKRVEVLRERTDVTQVFANPNGSLTMTSSARPTRVRRTDGTWAAIDTTLTAVGAGIKPTATTVDLTFSAGGTGALVSIEHDGTKLEVQPPTMFGAMPKPVLDGDTATYREVLPGVDLRLTADGQGYSEVLVVKDAKAAADKRLATITFPSSVAGGELKADAHGNLRVVGRDSSRPVFVGAAPSMWDSSTTRSGAVGVRRRAGLGTKVTPQTVSVTPNQALLKDPRAVYPLYIDPGVTVTTGVWSLLESADPNTAYYNTSASATIGTYNSGAAKFRSLFGMASNPLNGTHILSASFRIHEIEAWDCDSMPFELWSTSAISSATTWNNPPTWNSLLGTQSSGAGGDACPAADVSFPVTSTVQAAADASASNTWLGVRVNSAHESDSEYYKQFDNNPVLDVTYNTKPATPSGPTLSNCYINCSAPWKVSSDKPQFSVIVTDGDTGQRVQAEFQVRQGTTVIADALSNSGTSGAWVYWTPSTALTNGQSYTVRVRSYDGVDYSSWSADTTFSVDTTAPAAATVTSTSYPSGAWSLGADQAGSFTFGSNTDFAGFVYGLDENPPTTAVQASAGAATISLTPEVDGPHTLYVRPRDAAGNFGPVTSYAFNVGQAALTLPAKGQLVISSTGVQAVAPATATGYTLQWRRADTDAWTSVPTSDVTLAVGGGAVTWPQSRVSGAFPKLTWNVAKTFNDAEAGTTAIDGPVQARVLTSGSGSTSSPLRFTLDQSAEQAGTADVGPGSVNLVTGDLAVSSTDVTVSSYGSDLSIGRTFHTRSAATADPSGMFGTGWISTVGVQQEQPDYTGLTVTGSVVQVGTEDGSTIGFTATSSGFSPELGYEDLTLTHPNTATYQLAGLDGTVTTFTVPSGSTLFKPTAIDTPGSAQTTTTSWETVTIGSASVTRPTRILAPVPAGVSCGTGTSGLVKGCRALTFTYATATTATSTTPGDYTGRVSQISFVGWDPDLATPAMRTVPVTKYAYDSAGRLVSQWDPRLDHDGGQHLAVTYSYDSNSILSTITPVAQQSWQLSYTTIPGDTGTGRLKQVSRSALAAGTATTTVVYQVPTAGSGAPYDLSATQTSRWGQADPPVQATAVFGPDQVPDGSQSAGTMPSSWTRAQLTYMDTSGQVVNTVEPGGATTANWYDATGNVVRSLTASNRDRALNASTADTTADEAALAARLSTTNRYEASGRRLKESFGPEHDTAVPNVSGGWTEQRARTHTTLTYDGGAPTGGPYDLATTRITGARLTDGSDVDTRTTTIGYDWTLRVPTSVTTDPAGVNLTTRMTYDSTTGLPTSTTAPAGGTTTNTPRTTQAIYYSTAANSTYTTCGIHPEWANLPCLLRAGGNPSAGAPIPDKFITYDLYNQREVITEKTPSGTLLRTTTNTFDSAGRLLTEATTASTGTALPTKKNVYDATTGELTQTQSLSGATVTAQVSRSYDTLGRIYQYVDADNNTTATTYDLLSRTATVNDGKATQTLSYDNRGQLAQIVDTQAGTFTAGYNADGKLVTKGLPDTLTVTTGYDETGMATTRSTSAPGCTPATNCIDVDEQVSITAHGQWATHSTDFSGQQYTYDKTGRLTRAQDYIEPIFGYSGCTTRVYGFDDASNRTSYQRYAPAPGGGCQTSTASVSRTLTYDTADRAATSGYAYDALGRTTTVPSAETENQAGNLTVSYHVNDLVRSLTQAGATTTYTIDVLPDRVRSWTDGTTTSTDHYSDDNDSPSWTATGSTYTRYITGPDDLLAMTYDSGSGELATRLGDLHGNVIGIITGDTAPEIQSTYETDEYGVPYDSDDIGDVRYGYLGQHQRATDNPAGISLMGVRLYNAATGRFLTTDPVQGGSANPYDYCYADPINCRDLDGRMAVVALVGMAALGVSFSEVVLVIGMAVLVGLVAWAVWHGTRAAVDRLRVMWTKHAKKRQGQRHISNDEIQDAIRSGRKVAGKTKGTTKHIGKKFWVVTDNKSGRIISVGRN
ncbi:RHS repeat-associated core domain-containing protein [Actinoplanes sp. HUAS TT8]|uniref:RHS repeat-associated core domain-containing protein n=1 Tax=Actinoplanes sp. HUAS TT8 TaxID=3447453 RepID=UPI003F52832A